MEADLKKRKIYPPLAEPKSRNYPSRDGNASLRTDSGDGCSYESQYSHSTNYLHIGDSLIAESLHATQDLQTKRNLSGPRSGSNPSKRAQMDSRSTSTYPPKRVLVACQTCRIKKTKCDNQRPSCTTRIGLGVRCSYSGSMSDHSSFDAASLAILERVNHAVSLLEAQAKHMQQLTERPAVTGPLCQ